MSASLSRILGPDGRPIERVPLTEEEVTPSVTGVRHQFDDVVSTGLNPRRLARVMQDAAEGQLIDFLTLAEEMEERDGQYRSVLTTRKGAIKSIEGFVKAPTEDPEDVRIADAVKDELVDRPDFRHLIGDLLDGLGKGYSAVEMIWRTSAARWSIDRFLWRDPRLFHFDRETRSELRIRTLHSFDGLPLRPFKYVVHMPKLKSGIPARNGLARIGAWAYMLKSFSIKDWAAFLEVHGMPLRIGRYGPGSSAEDRRVLLNAVRMLGSDAAGIIPKDMEIIFQQPTAFSDKPFEGFAGYFDKMLSKIIIGQTMTADDGSSKAQAAIHDKVRIDIKEDDAVDLAATIDGQIIRPWVDLNYGPRERNRYPRFMLPVMEREDLAVFAKGVGELVDRGMAIEVAEVRDRLGFREPQPGAPLMLPRGAGREAGAKTRRQDAGAGADDEELGAADALSGAPAATAGWRLTPGCCPGCGAKPAALAGEGVEQDELDRLAAEEAARFERVMDPIRDALEGAFKRAGSFEELDAALARLAGELPIDALAERIAILNLKGFGLGRAGADTGATLTDGLGDGA